MVRRRPEDDDSGDEIDDDELDEVDDTANGAEEGTPTRKVRRRDSSGAYEDDANDEEDDEDEDDGDGGGGRRRKKRKTGASALIDEEAEEDDDADDEDDDDDLDGVNGLIADGSDDEGMGARKEAIRAQRLRQQQDQNDGRVDFIKRMEERYGRQDEQQVDEDDGYDGTEALDATGIDQQSLQPTVRDPRLFVVRCRKAGYERRAILSLLQKMFDFRRRGVDIGIISAVAPDHLKGLLYIEAFSGSQVEQAIRGLDLITGYNGIKPIPLEEMTDVLQIGRKLDKQKKGNWVRMTRGMYKGDLAQVYSLPDGVTDGMLMVRMIPRLRFRRDVEDEYDMEDEDEDAVYDDDTSGAFTSRSGRVKKRPPQHLFDPAEVQRLAGHEDAATMQRDRYTGEVFESWEGELYRHGLLYKKVSVKALIINDAVNPTAEELEKWIAAETRLRRLAKEDADFATPLEAKEGFGIDTSLVTRNRKIRLFRGDSIRVIRGEQKGLSGTVDGFDGSIVLIRTAEWPEPIRVARADVWKAFDVGDHVKITAGKHVGNSGVVVAADNEILTVFTDIKREEVRVLISSLSDSNDLTAGESNVPPSGRHSFKLFQLVFPREDRDAKGVVVGVTGETITVMDGHNMVHDYPASSMRVVSGDSFMQALDYRGNKLSRNMGLHVRTGPLKDRTGVIVEVTESAVFFKGSDETKNCGILAAAPRDCEAQAAMARTMVSLGGSSEHAKLQPTPVPRGALTSVGGGKGGFGNRGNGMNLQYKHKDSYKDKDVKVTKGPFKGHFGKVVDTNEKTVRVELRSKMKVITVSKDKVKIVDEHGVVTNSENTPGGDTRTGGSFGQFGSSRPPAAGGGGFGQARTPRGSASVRAPYGQRTPGNGSRTPSHSGFGGFGSRTPGHTSAFGGLGSRTPVHYGFGDSTPRHGSATPSRTPIHNDFRRPETPARADDYGSFGGFGQGRRAGTAGGAGDINGSANPYANPYGSAVPNTPGTPGAMPVTPAGGGMGGQPMDPMTPVDPAMVPQTPIDNAYMPQTPQMLDPQTPQVGGYEPPTPYGEPPTPGPNVPQTPATPEPGTPMPTTPGAMDEPPTPAPGGEMGMDVHAAQAAQVALGYRVLIDVVVSVQDMGNRSAVVLDAEADGSLLQVRLLDDGQLHQLRGGQVTPVQPRSGDDEDNMIKVLDGPLAGRVGRLTATRQADDTDSPHGAIDFGGGDVQLIDMALIAKYQRAA